MNADGSPALSIVVLARNREGYGNLCELITLARMRASKGEYWLTPRDLEAPEAPYSHLRGMPNCLVLFTPEYAAASDVLDAQAAWVSSTFSGRAWMTLTLHYRPYDDIHRVAVQEAAAANHLRLVAAGHVAMHVRSRKPLQDVMTAIRIGQAGTGVWLCAVAQCRTAPTFAAAPGQHLSASSADRVATHRQSLPVLAR